MLYRYLQVVSCTFIPYSVVIVMYTIYPSGEEVSAGETGLSELDRMVQLDY